MGYNIKQKPVSKYNFSNMRTKTSEQKVVTRDSMYGYKERIKELRQRLYNLVRINNETA